MHSYCQPKMRYHAINLPTVFDRLASEFFNLDQSFNWGGKNANLAGRVNLTENENAFAMDILVPGFDKNEVVVSISNGQLTISAEHKTEQTNEKADYIRREYKHASFKRSFNLSENIDANAITATHNNGVLTLNLPKVKPVVAEPTVKNIEIN